MVRLQFVREAGLASGTIAWFSAGHFSHVDAVLPDDNLLGARSDRVGGKPAGVQVRPPTYARFITSVRLSFNARPSQEDVFYSFLRDQIGKPYDARAIWGFLFNRDWRKPDSWICSELQAAALEASGLCPQLYLAANKITPVALALAFSAIRHA